MEVSMSVLDEPISVLIVMPQANLGGGAELMLLNFLFGARKIRPAWRFAVFFLHPGPFIDVLVAHGFEVAGTTNVRLRKPWTCAGALVRLCAHVKKLKANAILSWVAYGHIFGGLAGLGSRIPTLWYQIGFATGWTDRLASRIHSDRIIAVSEHIAKRQRFLDSRCPVVTVLPGIDLERFSEVDQEELRARLRLPSRARIAVLVGRLQRWKGIHTAIAAMPQVVAAVPNARLIVVGGVHDLEPDYPGELNAQVRRSAVEQSIALVGRQDNVFDWMCAADVVIHASSNEPFGIVAIEGMACGRPIITGNDGGVVEAVRDGIEGIHVPYEDWEQLAEALIRIFQDPLLGKEMGQRGLDRARGFSRDRYSSEICQHLDEAIAIRNQH